MYWAIGYDEHWNRDVGFDVPGVCDHPDCNNAINRGMDHVCGSEPYGGDSNCGLYFCKDHLEMKKPILGEEPVATCAQCAAGKTPYKPSNDTEEWIHYKQTSNYWAGWRTYHQNKRAR